MTACEHRDNVAAYVLGALPEQELTVFVAHLETCRDCRGEVQQLQVVADTLPLAVPQLMAPPELEQRLMDVVRAEADLLSASGADADRPVAAREPQRPWWRRPLPALRPLPAAIAAVLLIAVGVTTGILVSQGESTKTVTAQVKLAAAPNASAALLVQGNDTRLRVRNFPAPPQGDVYQVWLKLANRAAPVSADVLFNVEPDGSTTVDLHRDLDGVEQVLVTPEPAGGSPAPTSDPIIIATPA